MAVASAGASASSSSRRTSSVETPMRISPNASSPSSSGARHSSVRPRVDRFPAAARAVLREQLVEVAARRQPLADLRRIAVGDGDPGGIDDGRVGDVLRVDRGLQDRAHAGVGRSSA